MLPSWCGRPRLRVPRNASWGTGQGCLTAPNTRRRQAAAVSISTHAEMVVWVKPSPWPARHTAKGPTQTKRRPHPAERRQSRLEDSEPTVDGSLPSTRPVGLDHPILEMCVSHEHGRDCGGHGPTAVVATARVIRANRRSKVRTTLSCRTRRSPSSCSHRPRQAVGQSATLMRRNVGEKGNIVDAGPAVITAGPSIIERTTSVVSSTVVQGADTLRDKAIGAGVEGAVSGVRDRVKERRETGESDPRDQTDGEMPSPPSSSSPS